MLDKVKMFHAGSYRLGALLTSLVVLGALSVAELAIASALLPIKLLRDHLTLLFAGDLIAALPVYMHASTRPIIWRRRALHVLVDLMVALALVALVYA